MSQKSSRRVALEGRSVGWEGGWESKKSYRRATRGCVGSVIDLRQGVSLFFFLPRASTPVPSSFFLVRSFTIGPSLLVSSFSVER